MKVEYKVREVTRFVITEYTKTECTGGSRIICECDNRTHAHEIVDRLNKSEKMPQTILTPDSIEGIASGFWDNN
jgi:hypothetical protein